MDVAVLEPREVLRCGLATMLKRLESVDRFECRRSVAELVGQNVNGSEWKPDVVIVGYVFTDVVRNGFPSTRILEVIDSTEPRDLAAAAKTPADGYLVLPDITERTLDGTLQAVMRGELPMPRPIAHYLLDRARSGEVATPRVQPQFSPRERDVIASLLDGRSNMQIAQELGISLHSAKRHVSAVLHKVNSPSRGHFIAWMLREEQPD